MLEAGLYLLLKAEMKAGVIENIEFQPKVDLTEAKIRLRPDFLVTFDTGEKAYFEAKGVETDAWKLKLKLYRFYGDLPLYIYKGTMTRPKLVEKVIPHRK